jgi:hypothetical protein
LINAEITATILEVLSDKGNRVYRLSFSKPVGKSACVALSLAEHEAEKALYYHIQDDVVIVNVHQCNDFKGNDVYYAWQPRLPRKPSACPRCKIRMDIVRQTR